MTARSSLAVAMAALALALPCCGRTSGESIDLPAPLTLSTVPQRPEGAESGTDFARSTAAFTGPQRQQAAVHEILAGNVPSFVRLLRPVTLAGTTTSGQQESITLWVSPDYVAIGGDDDFLRVPLTWPSALTVAAAFGCVPPTPRIVDAIWSQADIHLKPAPLPPGAKMRSSEYYLRERALIEGQRGNLPPETLVAGHKKDVVLTPRLLRRPDRIAIYGWHRRNGDPIQPLSTVHGARYADYSHGLRLVCASTVEGEARSLIELLEDPELAPLLSAEGPIPNVGTLLRPR